MQDNQIEIYNNRNQIDIEVLNLKKELSRCLFLSMVSVLKNNHE